MEKYEIEINEENIKKTIMEDSINNNRKLYSLIRLINTIDSNATICIDGEWGTGKTIFINQFIYLLKNPDSYYEIGIDEDIKEKFNKVSQENLIVYYDAWKNDNHIDPFESIVYNILNVFPKYKSYVPNYTIVKDVILDFGKRFFEKTTFDIVNFENINTYEDLANRIVTMEEKQDRFKELIDKILGNKRLLLVIDELDRCNPLYASKLLETVKHFYNLKNITVIVIANNKELVNTIKKQYGYEFDAYSYLNKFYDFVITLDNSQKIKYAQSILGFKRETYLPHNIAFEMFKKYNFSYRDCNRYRTMYDVAKEHIEKSRSEVFDEREYNIVFDIILPIIIAYKVKDIQAYRSVFIGENKYLKESLEFIDNEFKKSEVIYGKWFADLTGKSDGSEIEEILNVFTKFKKDGMHREILDDCIKMSL